MHQRSSDQNDNTKRVFLKLLFFYTTSNHIRKEINAFFKKANLDCKLILINTTFNIRKLFQYKDRQKNLQKYGVVYKLTRSCGSTYIGQTKRNLLTRLKDHNPSCLPNQETDVTKYLTENENHRINFNDVDILAQSNHLRKLLIKETLLIQSNCSNINVDQSSTPLYICMFNA